jgi:hypothetical protein
VSGKFAAHTRSEQERFAMTTDSQDSHNPTQERLAQAEEMIWSLLDGNLPEADRARLEEMIKDDGDIRNRYVECVQLHTDLAEHFAGRAKLNISEQPTSSDSPVLGSLDNTIPSVEAGPPVTD